MTKQQQKWVTLNYTTVHLEGLKNADTKKIPMDHKSTQMHAYAGDLSTPGKEHITLPFGRILTK